ncbi:MAG: hypothetical protein JW908_04185 [Anaerolineales bacterium]|nr:hypothetical protein [Anaerolineales bacterium]
MNIELLPGLIFVLAFGSLMAAFNLLSKKRPPFHLREIFAFSKLGRAIGLSVEAGTRLHLSIGRSGIINPESASALVGLNALERITKVSLFSDKPPLATSGDNSIAILSQDVLHDVYRSIKAESRYDPYMGQLAGLTPLSYAVGTTPVIYDEQVSTNVLLGHFGSEVSLILDAAERSGSISLAGSDNIPAQAVIYATAKEPIIGEEIFATGAYLNSGTMHTTSVLVQDIARWVLILVILGGAFLKLLGVL